MTPTTLGLLDSAGWRDADGDGVRERDGRPFRFTALARGGEASPFPDIALFVQDALRRVGARMDVQPIDVGSFIDRLRAGDFEAALGPFVSGDRWLRDLRFGEGPPLGYWNARVADRLRSLESVRAPEAEEATYRELSDIMREEAPVTLLHGVVGTYFVHRRVRGLKSPWRADPVWFMEDLWVEEERP